MRGLRWLLLVAIAAVLCGVVLTYQTKKKAIEAHVLPTPQPLPPELTGTSTRGHYTRKDQNTGCTSALILYDKMNEVKDSGRVDLEGAEMYIYHKCEEKYDVVKSARANFFPSENRLYADGEVRITLGMRDNDETPTSLAAITTSGVTFDSETGHADTDRPTKYVFKNGEGESTGATYDPPSRELFMKHDVKIDWKAATPESKELLIEAPSLYYHEASQQIDMAPSGKLTRDGAIFEGDTPVIHMQDDGQGHRTIKEVDASKAHGTEVQPNRKLDYSADKVWVDYNEKGKVRKIAGEGNSRVVSTAEYSETTATANRVDLFFDAGQKDSVLTSAVCNQHAVVTSKPIAAPGHEPSETHIMRSESIEMKMRPGGKEIESVASHVPGTLEFLPNLPAQHHRVLEGREMSIAYAPQNRIDSFKAIDVKTSTDPNEEERSHNRARAVTASRDMVAHFDPQSSRLVSMEQTGNFTYQEGDRKAHAAKASLDGKQNIIVLDTSTAVSDSTGSTAADHIRMDQTTGDFTAEGNVNSIRLPDKDQNKNSQMLSSDAPLHAQARRMEYTNPRKEGTKKSEGHTRYQGNAALWQGANRIEADVIDIDKDKHTLTAHGNVVSNLWEQPKGDDKKKSASPVLTKVRAPDLVYADTDRLAIYSGGVKLDRTGMQLQSRELRAWMADSGSDSSLDHAFADGAVDILGSSNGRTYHSNSEHAEYYTKVPCPPDIVPGIGPCIEPKLLLNGGRPKLVRTIKGSPTTMEGSELTYWANDDRLLMKGDPQGLNTRIPPKRK
jgi:lipopolysaccharide export system protein LptA